MVYRKTNKQAKPPPTQTLNLDTARIELKAVLDDAISSTGTVTVVAPPPGLGKTFVAAEKFASLPDGMKAIAFVQTQTLARVEWQERIPDSVRLMSVQQMEEEKLLDCPFSEKIPAAQAQGLPYFRYYCSQRCERCGDCPYHKNNKDAKDAKVVIAQQAHWPFIHGSGLLGDRIILFDECPASYLRSKAEFSENKLNSFCGLLDEFAATGEADAKTLTAVRGTVAKILSVPAGQSQTFSDPAAVLYLSDAFQAKFNKFLSESHSSGWNLLPDLLDIAVLQRFVRCSEHEGNKRWWTIRPNLPPNSQPVIILDATGSRELYETLFPSRQVVMWPENPNAYKPKSEVTVFINGSYCQSSLWDTTVEPAKPSRTFDGILDHVEKTIAYHKADIASVGFVTLKKLTGAVLKKFAGVKPQNVLHYGNLRGRNELKNSSLVFIVGCQPPDLLSVAETAVAIGELDCEPSTLIGNLEGQREYGQVGGGEYEAQRFAFQNKYMKLAWEVLVTAEVSQAVGRARVHEDRAVVQRVYVFSNIDTGMPATHVTTRNLHLKSMGFKPPNKADEVYQAVMDLAAEKKTFGYKQIAERAGVKLRALRSDFYQAAIQRACGDMEIEVNGKPARFENKEKKI